MYKFFIIIFSCIQFLSVSELNASTVSHTTLNLTSSIWHSKKFQKKIKKVKKVNKSNDFFTWTLLIVLVLAWLALLASPFVLLIFFKLDLWLNILLGILATYFVLLSIGMLMFVGGSGGTKQVPAYDNNN